MTWVEVMDADGNLVLINAQYVTMVRPGDDEETCVLKFSVGSVGELTVRHSYANAKAMLEEIS